jgi:hypothetical protein
LNIKIDSLILNERILVLILFLIMSLTVIITGLSKKNVLLIQEISLLKKEVEEMKGNGKKNR